MPRPLERWQSQESALLAMVTIAMTPGGKLAVQANQDGTHGIQLVEQVTPPEQNIFPCVGIQFSHYVENPWGNRTHTVEAHFDIVVAVKQAFDPAVADTGRAALAALTNYINDGNGNGMSPMLRSDPSLLGNCSKGQIVGLRRDLLRGKGEGAGVIATAIYEYVAEDQVGF